MNLKLLSEIITTHIFRKGSKKGLHSNENPDNPKANSAIQLGRNQNTFYTQNH